MRWMRWERMGWVGWDNAGRDGMGWDCMLFTGLKCEVGKGSIRVKEHWRRTDTA